ncbi:MAG: glycoside hydrolase family 2 [Ruminococcaceae bacterium]|nr:glycoside hydrolase family 2 [Oscillospiraceae bacterium]
MERLLTRWGKTLNKDLPLNDYPRPQLKRDSFINLNGEWNYAIYDEYKKFAGYQGKIIVPFSPETILSGVEKLVEPTDILYYQRFFDFKRTNHRVLLHFGAVDYECKVILNSKVVGEHKGGYLPFTFDITTFVMDGENDLRLEVKDPTQTGTQARGKQTFKRGGIWYTPQSGIWQTVWIEEVCDSYIESIKLTPDIDYDELRIEVNYNGNPDAEMAAIALDKGVVMAGCKLENGKGVIKLTDYECWSPENPQLYDLKIVAGDDQVESYFGMRKFSVGEDEKGTPRFMLNNKPYFFNGLLDQGYWSDGMYTAPHDDALIYDIQTMKDLGFNTLRKHIKIEPLRWYYHCDRLGMIVWQDMINGGGTYNFLAIGTLPFLGMLFNNKHVGRVSDGKNHYGFFARKDPAGRDEYFDDSATMIDLLYNVPSLALWTPFNESWGQFESEAACEFYREKDPTRLIDHASGWTDQGAGDVNSFHIYFTPFSFPKYSKDDNRPIALTEFGGYSIQAKGHCYNKKKFFGYRKYYYQEKFDDAIRNLYENRILRCIKEKGLSAIIYTEVSDVEDECNGLLSYDREVIKITPEVMKDINSKIKL